MSDNLKSIQFAEENELYREGTSELDLAALAKLIGITQKEIAEAFRVSESQVSRGTSKVSENIIAKQWMTVFNILSEYIKDTDPDLPKDRVRLKIMRWLKMPNFHFGNETPLNMMMEGKARKVIFLLEQITC